MLQARVAGQTNIKATHSLPPCCPAWRGCWWWCGPPGCRTSWRGRWATVGESCPHHLLTFCLKENIIIINKGWVVSRLNQSQLEDTNKSNIERAEKQKKFWSSCRAQAGRLDIWYLIVTICYSVLQCNLKVVITSHFHQLNLQKSQQIAKQVRKAGRFPERFYFVRNFSIETWHKLTNWEAKFLSFLSKWTASGWCFTQQVSLGQSELKQNIESAQTEIKDKR